MESIDLDKVNLVNSLNIYEYKIIVDCFSLKDIYTLYLEPYLGPFNFILDIESTLMGELYKVLTNDTCDLNYISFNNLELNKYVKTDILNNFFDKLNNEIYNITEEFDNKIKGLIVSDLDIYKSFIIIVKIIKYY